MPSITPFQRRKFTVMGTVMGTFMASSWRVAQFRHQYTMNMEIDLRCPVEIRDAR